MGAAELREIGTASGREGISAPATAPSDLETGVTPSYTSLETMLEGLLERVRDALHADTAAVLLLDADRNVLIARAARGLEEEVRQGVQVPLARGFAGRVAAEARPIHIEDLDHVEVVNPILRQKGIRSMLGVPIDVDGRVIGVMHVGTLERREFNEEDVSLMQSAAHRAARAIDLARSSEERAVTEIMQRTLLPDALPNVPGMRFSAKYLPAGSGVKVGGDWYDVFQLPDGRMTFVIGDVVGRGAVAASVMSEIRIALRAYLMEGHRLAVVMSLLNQLLVSMGRNRGATAAILELDPETGEFEGVSAGHPPPLILDRTRTARFLELQPGMPLGIARDAKYQSSTFPFDAGSVLLLYTDGLVERRGEPIDEGMNRLRSAARAAAGGLDASFADRVYRGLLESAILDSARLEDDVALLAIESLTLGRVLEMTLDARPGVLAGLRRTVGHWLDAEGIGPADLFSITLAVSEAAANAIEHAYGAYSATFVVRCEHDQGDGQVRAVITDTGHWRTSRPYGRGRGLAIMRSLVDTVEIDRGEQGTAVTLQEDHRGAGMSGLEVERRDGVSVARPEGDIDVANAALMREDLAACIDGSIDTLVIDLSATRYLDSAAIDMLLRLGALLGDRRATLMLVIPAESQLTRLAAIVGLGAAMPVHTSVAAALSANAERISSLPAAGSDAREMTPGTGPQ